MTEVSPALIVRIACARFDTLEGFAAPSAVAKALAWSRVAASVDNARADLADQLYAVAGEASPDPARARARFAILAARRALHRGACVDPGTIAALPGAGGAEAGAAHALARLEAECRRARAGLEEALAEAADDAARALALRIEDPGFAEGLWLAGSALHAGALRLARDGAPRNARTRRIADTVGEYVVRAASKTSPQGAFCATAPAEFGSRSALGGNARPARLAVRVNVAEARKLLRLVPSARGNGLELDPALVRREDAYEFWRGETGPAGEESDRFVRIKATPALDALVAHVEDAPGGTIDRGELVAWAAAHLGEGAEAWLDRLVGAGLLRPRAGLPFDEPRPLRHAGRAGTDAPSEFERIESRLDEAGNEPDAGVRLRTYENVRATLAALPACPALDLDAALRVDAAAALTATVDQRRARELARVVPAYARWFAALYPRRLLLQPWVRRFLAIVGPDREVPLATLVHGAFDEPAGSVRASFPAPSALDVGAEPARWGDAHARREAWLDRRLVGASSEIGLEDADWSDLAGDTAPPRFACGVLFQEQGERIVINGLYGAGLAAARLARLHGSEAGFRDSVRTTVNALARPGALIAEIAYRHSGRTANAGLHPRVFAHVIVLPGETAGPDVEPIPLRDLYVRWDGARERFGLRSRRLDREIVPLLANGLSPDGFVAFLVAIGQQDAQPLAWFRDLAPRRSGAVPRVVAGDTVLFRRRWQWTREETSRILDPAVAPAVRFAHVQEWREQADAPRHVFVDFPRRAKPVHHDLAAPGRIEALARAASEFAAPTLREMWPIPAGQGPAGHAVEYLAHVLDAGERT